ncbi:hypothetical protein GF327_03410 [Candidatus Woesearchaeota archaeon]|nr:hypothetical protein [Candidatus Woesearchaeota archaeon]
MKITKQTPKKEIIRLADNCRKCGHCCSYGGCYVLEDEAENISSALSIEKQEFAEKYLEEIDFLNKKVYKTKIISKDLPFGKCIFLDEKRCMVQNVKPLHCRIGTCSEHGQATLEWFFLNHILDLDDPESIRQWAVRLENTDTIPGGRLHELVPDKKRLNNILNYEIVKKERDWDEVIGLKVIKENG